MEGPGLGEGWDGWQGRGIKQGERRRRGWRLGAAEALLHLLEVEHLGLLEDLERVVLAVLVLAQPHAAERARPQRRVQLQVGELQLGVLHGVAGTTTPLGETVSSERTGNERT